MGYVLVGLPDLQGCAVKPEDCEVGQLVKLVWLRGWVKKVDAGRRMTVRRKRFDQGKWFVVVDDGITSNPEPLSNGFGLLMELPIEGVAPVVAITGKPPHMGPAYIVAPPENP